MQGPMGTRAPALLAILLAGGVRAERREVNELDILDSTSSLAASESKAITSTVGKIKSGRARTARAQHGQSALGLREGGVVGEYRLVGRLGGALDGDTRPAGKQQATPAHLHQEPTSYPNTIMEVEETREDDEDEPDLGSAMHVPYPDNFPYTTTRGDPRGYLGITDSFAVFREFWMAKDSKNEDVVLRFLGARLEAEMTDFQHVTNWMARPVNPIDSDLLEDIFWDRRLFAQYIRNMAIQDARDCRVSQDLLEVGARHVRRCKSINFFLVRDDPDGNFTLLAQDAGVNLHAPIYSVLEGGRQGTLYDYVKSGRLTGPHQIASITRQILESLLDLAKHKMTLHHMLSPHNIFISWELIKDDIVLDVKLGNFGSAFEEDATWTDRRTLSFVTTYAPPELLIGEQLFGTPATSYDMFSVGYILCFMITGDTFDWIWPRSPLSAEPDDEGRKISLEEGQEDAFMSKLNKYQGWRGFLLEEDRRNFTKEFIRLMIANEPDRRPTPGDVLEAPWLKGTSLPQEIQTLGAGTTARPTGGGIPTEMDGEDGSGDLLLLDEDVNEELMQLVDTEPDKLQQQTLELELQINKKMMKIPDWRSRTWQPGNGCLPVCDKCEKSTKTSIYSLECWVLSRRVTELCAKYGSFQGLYTQPPVEDDPLHPKYKKGTGAFSTCMKSANTPAASRNNDKHFIWRCLPANDATVDEWIQWVTEQFTQSTKAKKRK